MAVNPKNYSPDVDIGNLEIIHDDTFTKSLFDIIRLGSVENLLDLRNSMDEYGYIGRYEIKELRKFGRRTDTFKIRIYLPDSVLHYNWPFKTNLTLGDYRNIDRIQKTLPPNSYDLIKELYRYNPYYSDIVKRYKTSKIGAKYKGLLEDYLLLDRGTPILKTKKDAIEIASNIVRL